MWAAPLASHRSALRKGTPFPPSRSLLRSSLPVATLRSRSSLRPLRAPGSGGYSVFLAPQAPPKIPRRLFIAPALIGGHHFGYTRYASFRLVQPWLRSTTLRSRPAAAPSLGSRGRFADFFSLPLASLAFFDALASLAPFTRSHCSRLVLNGFS